MKMPVTISYQRLNEDLPKTISIPDDEYHDPLEPDEQSDSKDSVAEYTAPHNYLSIDAEEEITIDAGLNKQGCHATGTLKAPGSKWTTVLNSLGPYRIGDCSDPIFSTGSWKYEDLKGFGSI